MPHWKWSATPLRLLALRSERLNQKLHAGLDEIYINGTMEHRLLH